ncbi:ABC transporter permease [Lapidilactobacillus bayanensis]|uniref:ABC transporter permease n=1 Tax=Lapidilactobacillus bayanensis TaxID=2485998 RepID=UPI000F766F73|nr:ABC transporter permease [Lapidilactobacillus bayanensis]
MLTKLALTGIKSRLKDYIVLFSGLIVSAATFYMFMTLATNKNFLGNNSMLSANNTMFIFGFGAVLLGIITLVYLIYANSFLMNMRQRDYGMFMMLGAKSRKIAQLIFVETFSIGMIATLVGSAIGVGLSQVVAKLLVRQLGLTLHNFNAFHLPAMLITLIFFGVLFVLSAFWNSAKLVKTPVMKLLHQASQPSRMQVKPVVLILQALLGLALLAVGYWSMASIKLLNLIAIPLALVTIVLGSYFTFNATFIWLISLLKRNSKFALKGLRNFTLSQLNFRIHDYTRMLAMISILFALALGAITVGLGFQNEISDLAAATAPYDLIVYHQDQQVKTAVAQLDLKSKAVYHYKVVDGATYYSVTELQQQPLYYVDYGKSTGAEMVMPTIKRYAAQDYLKQGSAARYDAARWLATKSEQSTEINVKFVSAAKFAALTAPTQHLQLIRVHDFLKDSKKIGQIESAQAKAAPQFKSVLANSKYVGYGVYKSLFSGMTFMGFFLGISFLAMLASCLMFKILSGAYSDVRRYEMLNKMGTRRGTLKHSVAIEIGVLYALPGVLGVCHVLFGLQLFKMLMINPYQGIWLPFAIFICLYIVYYLLTTWLYRGIVIPATEIEK